MATGSFAGFLVLPVSFFILSSICTCQADILFSTLPQSLVVTVSLQNGREMLAGESNITVTWGLNGTFAIRKELDYNTVTVKLCYAPVSQTDRAWRKTKDLITKDKTCQFKIVAKSFLSSSMSSTTWVVDKSIPTATYFVRAYAYNGAGHPVAYGQTTDAVKRTNLFQIKGVTGRHASLDIASIFFSTFSVLSLLGFFYHCCLHMKKTQSFQNASTRIYQNEESIKQLLKQNHGSLDSRKREVQLHYPAQL